jgi:hypothetical protein
LVDSPEVGGWLGICDRDELDGGRSFTGVDTAKSKFADAGVASDGRVEDTDGFCIDGVVCEEIVGDGWDKRLAGCVCGERDGTEAGEERVGLVVYSKGSCRGANPRMPSVLLSKPPDILATPIDWLAITRPGASVTVSRTKILC